MQSPPDLIGRGCLQVRGGVIAADRVDRLADHLLLEGVLAGDGLEAALEVRRDRAELSVHVLVPAEVGEA